MLFLTSPARLMTIANLIKSFFQLSGTKSKSNILALILTPSLKALTRRWCPSNIDINSLPILATIIGYDKSVASTLLDLFLHQ
jgi:hypothetical protein